MKVSELIAFLQTQEQDLLVAFAVYSEHLLLTLDQLSVEEKCLPRPDGWVHEARPDQPTTKYLLFPGN